jgi:vacuolar-type H+-ATPase subunit H
MNENSENPEFMKTIDDIRDAEKEYDLIVTRANEKADSTHRKAKETIHEEREKIEKEIVEYKNEQIRDGSQEIESEVDNMVKKAKGDASQVSKMKLEKKSVLKFVKDFVSSL